VAGCCENFDEYSGSGSMELVIYFITAACF
jgi:hypothetical protein